ncbi:putative EthD domain-containing protein [Seiridium cardinale]|uniref:EthD domain-containing protein n=1 Tax=Seiridium cardinale TaxID=138064 RepID=A0ABR2X892_9PEZI
MAEAPKQQGPLKYTVTHYRQPQHTHEAFIKWITEEHLPLAIPIFKKHGVLGYSLFITPSPLNDGMREAFSKFRPTWDFADFDAFLEYTIPDVETVQKVMSDPDWQAAIKDQDEWVDTSRALVSLGYHVPYLLETGEVVNMKK